MINNYNNKIIKKNKMKKFKKIYQIKFKKVKKKY